MRASARYWSLTEEVDSGTPWPMFSSLRNAFTKPSTVCGGEMTGPRASAEVGVCRGPTSWRHAGAPSLVVSTGLPVASGSSGASTGSVEASAEAAEFVTTINGRASPPKRPHCA